MQTVKKIDYFFLKQQLAQSKKLFYENQVLLKKMMEIEKR